MKFRTKLDLNGVCRYQDFEPINASGFSQLIDKVAASFGINPEYFEIPEAEIGKIILESGEIYAKFDAVYGLEIECSGLSIDQKEKLDRVLAEYCTSGA